MQTFLPYVSFWDTACVLDNKRLGKQRVEGKQILNCLRGKYSSWRFHPAVKMWEGYENALRSYTNIMILEWQKRQFKNTMPLYPIRGEIIYPPWLGEPRFHKSHRSNLLRKDPVWYGQFGWIEPNDLPYFWPYNRRNKKWVENVCYRSLVKEILEA